MKPMKWWLAALLVLCLCPALSGAVAGSDNITGYYVKALLPDNQADPSKGYFYLLMAPGAQQTLEVAIINENPKDIQVSVSAHAAFTGSGGVISYMKREQQDGIAPVDVESMLKVESSLITVPANGEEKARIQVSMPDEPFEGELLAGITLQRIPELQDEGEGGGVSIINVFAYAIHLRLTQAMEKDIGPDFAFTGVEMGEAAGFPALILHLENRVPLIVLNGELEMAVYPEGGGEAVYAFKANVDMAPYSHMPYQSLMLENPLGPGIYRAEATFRYGGDVWTFEGPLTIE